MLSLPGLTPQVGFIRLAANLLCNSGKPELRCNPSFFEKMDPRVKPGGDVWWRGGNRGLLLEVLCRRVVARIDRILQEFVLVVGPELADVGIGLDHRVDVAAILLLDLAYVDVADHVAELVEAHRSAQGVRHFRLSQR